ncbi:FNTB farnesyltransferase, partial [Centropus unirufus]|nr:FNTB farnesyltransferase [Centropus unirufus]
CHVPECPVSRRSAYCAASVASLTNVLTPALFAGTAEWIARCQNWEGGIGGVPGMEAHGGYTFCGMAALVILKKEHLLNLRSLLVGGVVPLAPLGMTGWVSSSWWCWKGSVSWRWIPFRSIPCSAGGLAIAQHFGSGELHHEVILGVPENRLQATHPVYNITPEKVVRAVMHFLQQPVPSVEPGA